MGTKDEQAPVGENQMREMAEAIRALQAQAKRAGESTLAYLLEMAALEAEGRSEGVGDIN
ncbi:hypothetical protein [Chenggangzhangella methanolivorans]|uniref:Uncharacterized protein n=1 Tax=Chenggangzhangella methanolivorans TaxID=1437009 RepID=A0A9E6RD59_9HYPH|nr:hypothetical protein [Chenggangzhangella methanolivorans]QZO01108.1 hypothetical protein K6K41_05920 [Chenggangzhangella methanolivorans]